MKEKKKTYEAPQLTVVNIKNEVGYAGSNTLHMALLLGLFDDTGDQSIESRTDGGTWGGDGWL